MNYVSRMWAIALFSALNACSQPETVGYYDTGEVKYRAPVDRQGNYIGDVKYFYKNGKVERIVPFSSGDVNGAVRRYYPTGELSAVEAWKNGKTDGNIEHYYQDGELKFRGVRRDTFWRDTLCWFYRNGELKDFKVYNQAGKMVDFGRYKPDGKKDTRIIYPLFISDTDSLREGQDYSFEIVLGNRRTNTITVKFLNPETKIDSIKGLYTKTRYVLRRPAPGIHTVRAKVYEYWQHGDTLMTNWYGIEHSFYVISNSKKTALVPHRLIQ